MGKNAIAFIAGLGTGMIQAKKDKEAKEERDADRKMRTEEHEARMEPIKEEKKKRKVLADASAPVTVEEGAGGALRPETMDNRDVGLPENAALPNAGLDTKAYRVAGQGIATGEDAQAAAAKANTPEAQNKRAVTGLRGIGDFQGAQQLETATRQGKAADLQLTQAERAEAHDLAFREITEQFSRQGWSAVPKIYENYQDGNTAKVVEDGKGGATVTILNAKGEPVGTKAFANEMDFITGAVAKVDPKMWVSMKVQEKKDAQAQSNADRSFGLAQNADRRADRADARASAAASKEKVSPGLKKVAETEEILGRKLTQPERERLAGFGKEDDKGDLSFATKITEEAVKSGAIPPEAAAEARQNLLNNIQGNRQLEKVRSGLSKAKADGKMGEAVAELRAKGMSDETIQSLGGEVAKAAKPAAAKPAALPAAARGTAAVAPAASPAAASAVAIDPAAAQAQLAVENAEMGAGKRMAYSPEVKAFVDQQKAEKQAQEIAASQALRAREGQRAVAASRGLQMQ